ncbi:hypothetical protein GCM10017767_04930 [Halomonas urumqiensis]|nr:hypothetical protein GCM10017767_04930 [Halomonas urumqiensis]
MGPTLNALTAWAARLAEPADIHHMSRSHIIAFSLLAGLILLGLLWQWLPLAPPGTASNVC